MMIQHIYQFSQIWKWKTGVLIVAHQVKNLTSTHEGMGSIPGLRTEIPHQITVSYVGGATKNFQKWKLDCNGSSVITLYKKMENLKAKQ